MSTRAQRRLYGPELRAIYRETPPPARPTLTAGTTVTATVAGSSPRTKTFVLDGPPVAGVSDPGKTWLYYRTPVSPSHAIALGRSFERVVVIVATDSIEVVQ